GRRTGPSRAKSWSACPSSTPCFREPDLMSRRTAPRFQIERWPTERPLLVLVAAASLVLWTLLAVSVIGLVYVALLGLFFFGAHLVFIARVRGSAVKLGTEQFPELHAAVERLA